MAKVIIISSPVSAILFNVRMRNCSWKATYARPTRTRVRDFVEMCACLYISAHLRGVWSDSRTENCLINAHYRRMAELLLDPAIRLWVILPIVLITLLFGLVRHYVTVLLKQDQTPEREKIKDA